ncbi:MAG: ABC transporter ATP-binding protein [Alphaproteobacteria bacterium]|nr:ABC transporter ATP-binding protein [Alphaproteobacteria bacterium]
MSAVSKTKYEKPSLSIILKVIAPFKKRSIFVLSIIFIDNFLASFGVGMILPVFQVIMEPDGKKQWVTKIYPEFADFPADKRAVIVTMVALIIFLIRFIIGFIRTGIVRDCAERLRLYWSYKIGHSILFGDYQRFLKKNQGVWLNDWLTEPLCLSRFFLSYMQYISSFTMVVVLFALGVAVNWKVMAVFVVLLGVLLLVIRKYSYGAAVDHSRHKSHLNQKLSASISESLNHIKDIKILNVEVTRLDQMAAILDRMRGIFVRAEVLGELPRLSGELISVAALAVVSVAATIIPGITIAEILPTMAFFFVAIYRLMTASTTAMTGRIKAWQEFHSISMVYALATEVHEESHRGEVVNSIDTDIEFRGVSFTYDGDRPVLKDANFSIERGKFIILSGRSGAGKTTVLDLLLRFICPQEGAIVVNGRNINEYELYSWRKLFGYVSQDAALFFGSVRHNITLDARDFSEDEIEKACRLSGCHDFIKNLPQGYETMVGERGYALSGGQRKRIAIARALIRNPRLLILDEATTSFESTIERDIINALRAQYPDLTIMLISHRKDEFSEAEVFINLEDGRVDVRKK